MRRRALLLLGLSVAACHGRPGPPTGALADLTRAAGEGNVARVRQIMESDAGLARASFEGAPSGPVRAAAKDGHLEVVRLLLDAGADPRERETSGQTPLHAAKTPEIAALLLEHGVSPDVRSSQGETPLMTRTEAPAVVERLLEAGAHPDLRDADGRTALHHAIGLVGLENLTSMVALCAFGADPDVRNEKGESARALAQGAVAEGLGLREQNAAMAELVAKGGACDALRRRPPAARAPADERQVLVFDARCWAGDAWACGKAGWAYEHGEGVAKDAVRATKLYELSCEKGHAWGCYSLGYAYSEGNGVPRDDARGVELFRKGCDGGYTESCGLLAQRLQRGRGVPKDEAAAVPLFDKACQGGDAWSCWRLADAYASGLGVARDATKAAALRGQACRGGEKRACGGA